MRSAAAQARVRCSDVAFRGYIAELPPGAGPAAFAGPAAPTHVLEVVLSDSEAIARMESLRADHVTGALYSRSDLLPGPHQAAPPPSSGHPARASVRALARNRAPLPRRRAAA